LLVNRDPRRCEDLCEMDLVYIAIERHSSNIL